MDDECNYDSNSDYADSVDDAIDEFEEDDFVSKYKLYLPTENELRTEIETQKLRL